MIVLEHLDFGLIGKNKTILIFISKGRILDDPNSPFA
jgi:hypothetical protein